MRQLVDIQGMTTSYGSLVVLESFDLHVEAGDVVVVVGANGTGKSTLLRAICSLQPSDHDRATIAGHPLGTASARAAASFAGDEPVFFTDINLDEQLRYLASLGRAVDPVAHVDEIVGILGLGDRRDDLPVTMSRGWRQRTALACAMARSAPVLCVDEPFVGLDTAGKGQLVAALDWYRSSDRTVIVATHDAPGLDDLSPRLVSIDPAEG